MTPPVSPLPLFSETGSLAGYFIWEEAQKLDDLFAIEFPQEEENAEEGSPAVHVQTSHIASSSASDASTPETTGKIYLGDFVRQARRKAGYSQIQLAKLSGVSNRILSEIETHNCAMSAQQATDLAPYLNVSAEMLTSKKVKPLSRTQFSITLKNLREQKRLLQTELSAQTNVDYRIISAVESGKRELHYDEAVKLAKGLDVNVEALISKESLLIGKRLADTSKEPLGETLMNVRNERQYSYRALSNMTNICTRTLIRCESGNGPIKMRIYTKIISALGLTIEEACA